MSILNKFSKIFKGKSEAKSSPMSDRWYTSNGVSLGSDKKEISVYNGQVPWVSVAVDAIVRDVVSQKWGFVNKDGEEIDIKNVPDEIKVPFEANGELSFKSMLKFLIPNRLLSGNSFLWQTKGTRYGQFYNINDVFLPLSSKDVKIALKEDGLGISHYEVKFQDGSNLIVKKEDMIHSKQNMVISPYIGIGNIAKGRLLFEGDIAATEYINSFLVESKKMPLSVIIEETPATMEDASRKAEMIKQKYSNKTAYINGEGIKIESSSLLQKDFKFIEMKDANRQTALSLFGVPPEVVGITDNSNKATSMSQFNGYYKGTINPLLIDLEDEFTEQFIRRYSDDIFFKFIPHATGDIDNVVKKLASGIITPNRAAELCGEKFDELDEVRNTYYTQGLMLELGSAPITESQEVEKKEEKALPSLSDPRNVKEILNSFSKSATEPKKFQRTYLESALKSRNQIESRYVGKLSDYFKGQEKRIKENIRSVASKSAKIDISDIAVGAIFNLEEEIELLNKDLLPLHTSGVQKSIGDINSITGASVNLNTSNPFVVKAIAQLGRKISGKIQETTLKELQGILKKGVDNSWNINQFQDAIQDKFDMFQGYRARMIARTESRAAWDAGAEVAYKELDVKTVDVVGCTQFEKEYDCGKQDVPVSKMSALKFHPNHIGAILPSRKI